MSVDLFDVIEATWPAASTRRDGVWIHRDGAGGGKRVSATTLDGAFHLDALDGDLADLYSVREGQEDLDAALADRGYTVFDPSVLYSIPIAELAQHDVPRIMAFEIWKPLQIMRDLWAEGGIGPERIAVMERTECPKTSILGRIHDRAAGAAFVGMHGGVAMAHAVEILEAHRRKGLARHMMVQAAKWGVAQGADTFAVVTTEANDAARALYTCLGMTEAGRYHYRVKPTR